MTPAPSFSLDADTRGVFMNLADITDALRAGRVRITDHADEEAEADRLSFDEIYFSVFHGEVIEEYSNDTPYRSFLIFGQTFRGEPI